MKRTSSTIIGCVLATLAACADSGGGSATDSGTRMEEAFDACLESSNVDAVDLREVVEVADEGETIIIDTGTGSDGFPASACMFLELGMSDATVAKIDSTTAMMGRQTAEDDGLLYEWTYHPDSGMNMTITEE